MHCYVKKVGKSLGFKSSAFRLPLSTDSLGSDPTLYIAISFTSDNGVSIFDYRQKSRKNNSKYSMLLLLPQFCARILIYNCNFCGGGGVKIFLFSGAEYLS